jgi:23S rRNA (uracil747-C5)-methyltransferase
VAALRDAHPGQAVTVHLRPGSFFQTNTVVATALYAQARDWAATLGARSVWDLYCGAGGFALHLDGPAGPSVVGIEVSAEAVTAARHSAAHRPGLRFEVGDAAAYAREHPAPDLVVVNPPRRGIGAELADQLEHAGPQYLLYSSCSVTSLAADLARMPSLRVQQARLFAMFPQTRHAEVLVLATRASRRR